MGIEEFCKHLELVRRPDPTPRKGPTWDLEAWEASKRRFGALVDVWFHQPLIAAGFRGKAYGRGAVRAVLDLQGPALRSSTI